MPTINEMECIYVRVDSPQPCYGPLTLLLLLLLLGLVRRTSTTSKTVSSTAN